MYANHVGYTDIDPFEIVRKVSDKTLEIREMKAKLDPSWKPEFIPGGFSAHCTNQREQRWLIEPEPEAPIIRIRLSKSKGWQDAHGRRFELSDRPVRFYDYNF
jgi:hypothetical protein